MYQLLDFGDGRRLERFGDIVLDRPCPAAEAFGRADPDRWTTADARFEGRENEKGRWTDRRELPERWTVSHGPLRFELKRTDFGHLGLFPEQIENWQWIMRTLSTPPTNLRSVPGEGQGEGAVQKEEGRRLKGDEGSGFRVQGSETRVRPSSLAPRPSPLAPKVLNLFAYTGGSTLAAAAAGAEVVHVDAAENVVAWAHRNAELSGLAQSPIRWIAEDAVKFVRRELKRGNRYDAVVLDPPSYGHGPRGEVWRLSKHLPRLLAMCGELTAGRPQFMLLTCHTPGYDAEVLSEMVKGQFLGTPAGWMKAGPLSLRSADGRQLPSGVVVRWTCQGLKHRETASGRIQSPTSDL
jgi:23S rRNA (cytosine1962-C5)-methyltransferase